MTCRGLGVLTVSGRVASHAMTAVTIPTTDPSCVRGSKTCDIRNEGLILMAKRHQHKPVVPGSHAARKLPMGHGDTKLQRHVESSQVRVALSHATRKIVNRVLGGGNSTQNSRHARFGYGPGFQGATRHESAADRGKYGRVKEGTEVFIIWTVDKNGGGSLERERTLAELLASLPGVCQRPDYALTGDASWWDFIRLAALSMPRMRFRQSRPNGASAR